MTKSGQAFVYLASGAFAFAVTVGSAVAGNGSPSGSHFTLNLIGSKNKTSSMTDTNRRTIFVPLQGNCKINLAEGDFSVLDGNCFDGPAEFQLPDPDPTRTGTTVYSVFVRALGKPGGSSVTTTCATDPADGSTVCSVATMELNRSTGKSTFTNVSKSLLYIYQDIDGDGTLERVSLFDDRLQDYYWDYENSGLRLAQFRFYECATIVPDASDPNGQQIDTDCFN
jgi:hypothetical protein